MTDDRTNIAADADGTQQLGNRGLVVASLTGCSRVFGLLREVVFSATFGAGLLADAFFVAFRIPNFFRRLLAEGAFAQAFVPILAKYQEGNTREELEEFVQTVAGNFGLFLIALCFLGTIIAPALIAIFTLGGWQDETKFKLATQLLMIMFSYLGLISFTAFLGSVLNTFNRFAVPAFSPIWLNVAIILAALGGSWLFDDPIYGVAWAVIAAGLVQFGCHLPGIMRMGLLKAPRINWKHPGVSLMLKLLAPAVFAASVVQINILVGTGLAWRLGTGSVSWLYYADRLIELPVGMIAIALQTVILPKLSRLYSRYDLDGYRRHLRWGIQVALLLGLPATVGLIVLSVPLISTLFFHGEFLEHDVLMVGLALQAFAVGLVPVMLAKVMATGFFAQQNTKTPFYYATVSVVVNVGVSIVLVQLLGPSGIGHVGIAVATSAAAVVHILLLVFGLMHRKALTLNWELGKVFVQSVVGCIVMVVILLWLLPSEHVWADGSVLERITWLGFLIGSGMITYFGVCFAVGVRLHHFVGRP